MSEATTSRPQGQQIREVVPYLIGRKFTHEPDGSRLTRRQGALLIVSAEVEMAPEIA